MCVGDGREYSSESAAVAAAAHMRITIQGVPRRRACEDSYIIRVLAPKALEKPATSVGMGACAWRGKRMKEGEAFVQVRVLVRSMSMPKLCISICARVREINFFSIFNRIKVLYIWNII